MQQTAYVVARQHKVSALARVLDIAMPKPALVFCRTRLEVDEVTAALNSRGTDPAIHGGMSQVQRDRVMQAFRTGQTELLVATDVAARGLDIPSVSHVINTTCLHRWKRTCIGSGAQAGPAGKVRP